MKSRGTIPVIQGRIAATAILTREWAFTEARRRAAVFDEPFAVYRERRKDHPLHIVRAAHLPKLNGLHWELAGTVATAKRPLVAS
jgi:hypothetical protein